MNEQKTAALNGRKNCGNGSEILRNAGYLLQTKLKNTSKSESAQNWMIITDASMCEQHFQWNFYRNFFIKCHLICKKTPILQISYIEGSENLKNSQEISKKDDFRQTSE